MHIYQDISHAGAPYSNIAVRGFGEDAAPAGTLLPEHVKAMTTVGPDGVRHFNEATAKQLEINLGELRTMHLTSTRVSLVPITAEEKAAALQDPGAAAVLISLTARKWAIDRTAEGYAVYVPFALVFTPMAPGLEIGATLATDRAAMKQASEWPSPEVPLGSYLTDPYEAAKKAGVSTMWWAIGGLAVVGGGLYWANRKK